MDAYQQFITTIRRKQTKDSISLALEIVDFLRGHIGQGKWTTGGEMIEDLRDLGTRLVDAAPSNVVVGNVVRRVLHIIREEFSGVLEIKSEQPGSEPDPSLQRQRTLRPELVTYLTQSNIDYDATLSSHQVQEFKPRVIEAVESLKIEIQNVHDNIAEQAELHIHHNEQILVYGFSNTILKFLAAANRKGLSFDVCVAESPDGSGHHMVQELRKLPAGKVQTKITLVPDSSIFTLMSRMNTVLVSTRAVLANGGLLAVSGTKLIALAAKHHAVPVVVCAGMYKLSPLFPSEQVKLNVFGCPSHVIPDYETKDLPRTLTAVCPELDYVEPSLLRLFCTSSGTFPSTYIYKLLADLYSEEDYELTRD